MIIYQSTIIEKQTGYDLEQELKKLQKKGCAIISVFPWELDSIQSDTKKWLCIVYAREL